MLDESMFQLVEVDVTVVVLVDLDHVGNRLTPRQLIRVVLVGPDEHHRSLIRRDLIGEAVPIVELRRDSDSEDADETVDGAGGPGAGEDHGVLIGVGAQ